MRALMPLWRSMTRAFGIDISKWQTSSDGKRKVDFDVIKKHSEPVTFIAARAGSAANYVDPQFYYYWSTMCFILAQTTALKWIIFSTSWMAK
jgi:hypothetical protein